MHFHRVNRCENDSNSSGTTSDSVCPRRKADTYFYSHNNGLQNQSLLDAVRVARRRTSTAARSEYAERRRHGRTGWNRQASDDGKLLAYSLADGGSDWRTWKVRNVETGKDTDDEIRWSKFSGIAWLPDQSGFFYARYARPRTGLS